MTRIMERHPGILDTYGIDVLAEKEAFLVELAAYHEHLLQSRLGIEQQIAGLDNRIAAARRASEKTAASPEPEVRAAAVARVAWVSSPLKRSIIGFWRIEGG